MSHFHLRIRYNLFTIKIKIIVCTRDAPELIFRFPPEPEPEPEPEPKNLINGVPKRGNEETSPPPKPQENSKGWNKQIGNPAKLGKP